MLVLLRSNTFNASKPCRNFSGTVSRASLPWSSRIEAFEHCIMQSGSLVMLLPMKETLLREFEFENSPTEISLNPIPERTRDLHPSSDDDQIHIATSRTTSCIFTVSLWGPSSNKQDSFIFSIKEMPSSISAQFCLSPIKPSARQYCTNSLISIVKSSGNRQQYKKQGFMLLPCNES